MFKTNFSEQNKIWVAQKDLGVTAPECPPCACGPRQNLPQKVFHLGPFMSVQGE